ncbi:hypothetical protein [Caenimonas soli]|jgi:hypothetical protein|uniref:hypothetical protein n=1 Tax=Caenimonas soli TaxID=2735555 RepID=UPI001555784E|nr:hypothetical protein [Caenimonas soli]NPC57084.1 hypothetical protein [Caenimonas soli]
MSRSTSSPVRGLALASALALASLLGGCAVVAVGGAAVGLAATGAGLVVDAAVGTVKLTGKAVGAAVDAVTPGDGE